VVVLIDERLSEVDEWLTWIILTVPVLVGEAFLAAHRDDDGAETVTRIDLRLIALQARHRKRFARDVRDIRREAIARDDDRIGGVPKACRLIATHVWVIRAGPERRAGGTGLAAEVGLL